MHLAARQLPDEPRFHRAEQQLAACSALLRAGNMIEQPSDLRRGEIGVDLKSRFLCHQLAHTALFAQRIRNVRRAAALPDDGVIDRFTGRAIPQDRCFALVRNADGRDLAAKTCFAQRLRGDRAFALPDLVRVVLDPPRLRIMLPERLLCVACDAAVASEQNGARAGRSLIERQNIPLHEDTPLSLCTVLCYTKVIKLL